MKKQAGTFTHPDLLFATIVATPTATSWSQAYSAGSLFVVLSIKNTDPMLPEAEDAIPLSQLGKDVLDTVEQEYFTLETKDLESIKNAIAVVLEKIPSNVTASLAALAIVQHIVYVFAHGNGQVVLKRADQLGALLEKETALTGASGYIEPDDILALETEQFGQLVSYHDLTSAMDHLPPSEIAEILAPNVHGQEEGGACAIIVSYNKKESPEPSEENNTIKPHGEDAVPALQEDHSDTEQTPSENRIVLLKTPRPLDRLKTLLVFLRNKLPVVHRFTVSPISHRQKIFLTVAVVLIAVLTASIFFAKQKQQDDKTRAAFQAIMQPAQKKYDEGSGLVRLNRNLARDNFLAAQSILIQGLTKLPKGTKEERQAQALLAKINSALSDASNTFAVAPQPASQSDSELLSVLIKNPSARYVSSDEKNMYIALKEGISVQKRQTTDSRTILKSQNNWSDIGGFSTFLGNIYVVDKKSTILKFTPSGDSYNKSNYLSSPLDLSRTQAMAIDGAVWLLEENGEIFKFVRGKAEPFTVKNLDKAFSSPARIATDADTNNLYILDPKNKRIVVLGKDGDYQTQYVAEILKNVLDMDVREKDKKIFVLAKNKVWEVDIE